MATIIAIAFALYDYRRALTESQRKALEAFERITANFPLTGKASLQNVTQKITGNTEVAYRWIGISQTVILMLATFIWGFGDLASGLMSK